MGSFPNTLVVICHQEFISLSIMLIVHSGLRDPMLFMLTMNQVIITREMLMLMVMDMVMVMVMAIMVTFMESKIHVCIKHGIISLPNTYVYIHLQNILKDS